MSSGAVVIYALTKHLLQVARLQRELERHTEERDKAREEGKRAEQERVQLLLELKVRPRWMMGLAHTKSGQCWVKSTSTQILCAHPLGIMITCECPQAFFPVTLLRDICQGL